jgi:hypothetical protein
VLNPAPRHDAFKEIFARALAVVRRVHGPLQPRSDGDFLCDNSLFSLANRQAHLTKWIGPSGKAMSRDGLVVVIFFALATALAMGFLAVALSFPELMPWYSEPSPPG